MTIGLNDVVYEFGATKAERRPAWCQRR